MKYKRTMPKDVRELCCAHARGYERRLRETAEKKDAVYRGGKPQSGVLRLEELAGSADERSIAAVEEALLIACVGIRSPDIRRRLCEGIMLNIANRKRYPYEQLHIPTVGRNEFYRRKNDFIFELADLLGFETK